MQTSLFARSKIFGWFSLCLFYTTFSGKKRIYVKDFSERKPCFRIDFANYTSFFSLSFADARFFDLSSTYYSDKRQSAVKFWQQWYKSTPLYSNGPGQKPYDGDIFGKGGSGVLKPATLAPEVTPTVGVFFRTDSQFSVEQSVATRVYEQSSYGRLKPTHTRLKQ